MKTLPLLLSLLTATALGVEPYPIVYVRMPHDPVLTRIWPSVTFPTTDHPATTGEVGGNTWRHTTGGDLVLLKPDGTEEVLLETGETGMVFDPQVDGKAEWVYYAKFVHPTPYVAGASRDYGTDIFKLNLQTKEEVRLTGQEFTPSRSLAYGPQPLAGPVRCEPVKNSGPCLIGNQVIFSSTRDCLKKIASPAGSPQVYLTYTMDTDGKNVECIGPGQLGAALHNEVLKNGKIIFSTHEMMGFRWSLAWGIWGYNRDGTEFEPFQSAFNGHTQHGHCGLPDGRIAFVDYYPPRNGTGGIGVINPYPTGSPSAPSRFFGLPPANGVLDQNLINKNSVGKIGFPHSGWGQYFMTSGSDYLTWPMHGADLNAYQIDGVYQGFVTNPSPAPNGLLVTWTGSDTNSPRGQGRGRIMRVADYQPITNANQLVEVKSDPDYSYIQPRAVLTHEQIYGQPIPISQWNPNDGTRHPTILPKGTPFALVGSASTIAREWQQWGVGGGGSQIVPVVTDDDIHYVRIYVTRPTPQVSNYFSHPDYHFRALNRERIEILCDIPVRHVRPDGTEPTDAEGNPDTSWLAKIPADTAYTFAVLNKDKEQIAFAKTWHWARPGEVRHDCGGCHYHGQPAVEWTSTLAYRWLQGTPDAPFAVANATNPPRILQQERDIDPIVAALGLSVVCRTGTNGISPAGDNVMPGRALKSPLYTSFTGTPEQKRLLGDWIDAGASQGPGILHDDMKPTLTVQEPNREQPTPITAIRFGAFDLHSGLATVSAKASFPVQGRAAGVELADLFSEADHVWTLAIPEQASGEVTVTVTDGKGNNQTLTRTFPSGNVVTPPNPNQEEIDRLKAELASLQILLAEAEANVAGIQAEIEQKEMRLMELEH